MFQIETVKNKKNINTYFIGKSEKKKMRGKA